MTAVSDSAPPPAFDLIAYLAAYAPHAATVVCERPARPATDRAPAVAARVLPHPDTGQPVTLALRSPESAEGRGAAIRFTAALGAVGSDLAAQDALYVRQMAEMTVGWSLPAPYTVDEGVALYTTLFWVRELVDAALAEQDRFFGASGPDSSPTPSTTTG